MASVAVLGAVGYAGAIAAQLLYRHPFFELAHVTARAEAGQRLDDVHPRTRVPLELEVFDARSTPSTRRSSPTRTARRRRSSPSCAAAGTRVVDLSADFRLRDRAIYEDWYGEHKAPELLRAGRLRAAGAHARGGRGRRSRRQPRLLPDRGAARAGAAGARGADRRRRDRRQVRRLRRRARADARRRTSSPPTRTSRPTRSTGHRHTPEIEQELGALGDDADDHVHAAPAAARPGRAGLVLRDAVARRRRRTSWPSSSTTRTRASRSSSCAAGRSA